MAASNYPPTKPCTLHPLAINVQNRLLSFDQSSWKSTNLRFWSKQKIFQTIFQFYLTLSSLFQKIKCRAEEFQVFPTRSGFSDNHFSRFRAFQHIVTKSLMCVLNTLSKKVLLEKSKYNMRYGRIYNVYI